MAWKRSSVRTRPVPIPNHSVVHLRQPHVDVPLSQCHFVCPYDKNFIRTLALIYSPVL